MIKTFIATIIMSLALLSSVHAQMTPREAAEKLSQSVVSLQQGWGNAFCTGFKINTKTFLTAGHCSRGVTNRTRLVSYKGDNYTFIKSVLITKQEKKDGKRQEDWAILNTSEEMKDVTSLTLGCKDEIYLGMPIAYAGYPAPVDFAFAVGYVMSVNKVNNDVNDLDFVVDLAAAPGASGSPIINLDTGHIIGVLTEGVFSQRIGAFGVGIEHIASLDLCDDILLDKEYPDISDTF